MLQRRPRVSIWQINRQPWHLQHNRGLEQPHLGPKLRECRHHQVLASPILVCHHQHPTQGHSHDHLEADPTQDLRAHKSLSPKRRGPGTHKKMRCTRQGFRNIDRRKYKRRKSSGTFCKLRPAPRLLYSDRLSFRGQFFCYPPDWGPRDARCILRKFDEHDIDSPFSINYGKAGIDLKQSIATLFSRGIQPTARRKGNRHGQGKFARSQATKEHMPL